MRRTRRLISARLSDKFGHYPSQTVSIVGSGCGSVGRAVTSDTLRSAVGIQSSAKIIYIEHLFTVNCVLKRQNKEKEAGNGPFFNCLLFLAFHWHNRLPLGLRQTFISFYERAPWQNLKHVKGSDQKGLFFKKIGPSSASFSFIFFFSNKHYDSYNKYMRKNVMTTLYTALGFEPMTFGIQVCSHNH